MVYSDHNNKKIYQTMCLAKESNKSKAPVTCIVLNLSSFLQRLENINFPYKVNFHYTAEDPSKPFLEVNLVQLLFFGLLGFIAWKVRGSFKSGGMGDGGIG